MHYRVMRVGNLIIRNGVTNDDDDVVIGLQVDQSIDRGGQKVVVN